MISSRLKTAVDCPINGLGSSKLTNLPILLEIPRDLGLCKRKQGINLCRYRLAEVNAWSMRKHESAEARFFRRDFIHVYLYICVYMCIHTHTDTHTHAHTHTYIYIYIYIYNISGTFAPVREKSLGTHAGATISITRFHTATLI